MKINIAFVGFEARGEFVVVRDVIDFILDPTTRPPADVPEFRGYKLGRIKIVFYPRLLQYGSNVGVDWSSVEYPAVPSTGEL